MAAPPNGRQRTALRSVAPFAVLLGLVAVVAAAMSGVSAGTSTVRGQPTSYAFSIGATLLVLAAAASLVQTALALLRILRQRASFGRERRSLWATVGGSLAAAGFFLLLFYILDHYRSRHPSSPHPLSVGGRGLLHGHSGSSVHFVPAASVGTVVVLLIVALLIVGIPMWRRRKWSGWHSSFGLADLSPEDDGDAAPEDGLAAVASAISSVRVADPREEPDPRRAVVLAYLQMIEAAESAGALRHVEETPREFLSRLLASVGAPEGAARSLTTLFELARYSTLPMSEADRDVAIASLEEIRVELHTVST